MKAINFIKIGQETEKAIKVIIREAGYNLEKFKKENEVSFWIPKSIAKVDGNMVSVPEWFYDKNIAANTYGAFMKSLANS